jgi:hypothetical protein
MVQPAAEAILADFAPFAQAACISAVHAPEAIMALQASALIGQLPDAAQPPFFAEAEADAAVAVVACAPHELALAAFVAEAWVPQQDAALAVFVAEALVPQADAALADFAPSQAKAAAASQAVAAMARARSRNGFMSNLPEGGAGPLWPRC